MIVLIAGTVLSLVGIAIIPTYEANAKECNNGDRKTTNDNNDKNNNDNDDDAADSTTCTDKKDSNDHEHSSAIAKKDSTPFLLPIPFP
jgi:hypothetical protein